MELNKLAEEYSTRNNWSVEKQRAMRQAFLAGYRRGYKQAVRDRYEEGDHGKEAVVKDMQEVRPKAIGPIESAAWVRSVLLSEDAECGDGDLREERADATTGG